MSSPQVVAWLKCIICQKETAEKTQCPANSKRNDSGAGYLTIERDLTSFHEAGELHLAVDWENLDEGNGISQTFENHRATWHKSCRDKFNKTKVDRLLKRKLSGESHDQKSSKRTRTLFPDSKQSPVCFFCEAPATDGGLREACTMDIDSRVRSVAHELCDVNLLSKLSTGDMVALGAKYHSSCLAALYNRARRHSKGRLSQENDQCMYHSIALAELISEIQNAKTEEPHTTVFKLSDLRKEFCKRLQLQGVTAENPEIHSTRLKEKLIEAIPGLTAHIKGREVLLAFEEDIGSLISRALPGENNDNALCLERTANIVREEMFNESSSATGSATQSCQRGSVPQTLLSLVSMILEGPNAKRQLTGKPSQAALTLAQLLKFNSVKHALKSEQCVRHIKSQETPLPVYIGNCNCNCNCT